MKHCLPVLFLSAACLRAAVVTSFEEAALPAAMSLDIPNASLGNVVFDAGNDELDFVATGNTDMWLARNNAPIAWTAAPAGLVNGNLWSVETEVRINNVTQDQQVAGITFYGGPDGANPDFSFGLDNWNPSDRNVRLQGLGDNTPNVGVPVTAAQVFLRVLVQEGGATDAYNFFYKLDAADGWTQLGGVAANFTSNFGNNRVGLTYKTGLARDGAAFTYFNVAKEQQKPSITGHPANLTVVSGGAARLSVTATGATSYQWRRNTQNVPLGGTSPVYAIEPVTAEDNGATFDCVVTNEQGSTTSNPASLTVTAPAPGAAYYTSAVNAEPSLLAYFPVDGSTASQVENVKNTEHHGLLKGTAAYDSTSARTVGSKAVTANGSGWVELEKDPAWDFPDGNGTVELFAYQSATAGYNPTLFSVRQDGTGVRYSFHSASNGSVIYFWNGAAAPTWALPSSSIGRLMHLVFVMDGGKCTCYHNGVSLGTIDNPLGAALNLPAQIGSSGPSSQEGFVGSLDNVAVYDSPLPASAVAAHYAAWQTTTTGSAPVIATPPASQSVNETSPVTFSVALTNAAGAIYRWQKDGVDIEGATAASYSLPEATLADDGATFRCIIYNAWGGVTTAGATLTVVDTNAPKLLSAAAPASTTQVLLIFDEAVDLTNAVFTLSGGGTVSVADSGPLPGMVTLWVSGLSAGQSYTVTATGVRDTAGNVMASTNSGFTAMPPPVPAPVELVRPAPEPIGPATRRGPFVFSEIHYHPETRTDLKDLEFIEIYNAQPWQEDLSGFRIAGEVNYAFPAGTTIGAGGRLVVAAVPAYVQSVYNLTGVLGPWSGSLNNSGGNVSLIDISGGVVFTVDYDGGSPWPVAADGTGHSLVLARPSYGMENPRAWDISVNPGGTPGAAEPTAADPWRTVMINEVRSTASFPGDFIELYNYSTAPVDLSGCTLSDDRNEAKYVFPAASSIPAGGFRWVDAAALGFGLKEGGDTVFFRAPSAGGVPGRVLDAVKFGPQPGSTTYGRWPDGAATFSVLDEDSAGAPNDPPAKPEAVISEILYQPPVGSTQPPFVEIANLSAAPLDVSGWRLTGGVTYVIPSGTVLPADGHLAVTGFSGNLNRGTGERLRLEKPEPREENGATVIMYPVIDEVTYGTGGRWGRWSDGGGSSLERRNLHTDGRLAANWADSLESDESEWVTIQKTGVLDFGSGAGMNRLHIMMLGAGECLVDEVEVIPFNTTTNLVPNGGFEQGLLNWTGMGTHQEISVETSGFTGFSMHVRAEGRGDLAGNRITVPLNTLLTPGTTATVRAKVKWLRGHPEILLRLNGGNLEATGHLMTPAIVPGTPGAANSQAVDQSGPAISAVTHLPVLPAANAPVTVYAQLTDPDGIGLALLNYRLDPSSTINAIAMSYRGAGLYSAELPARPAGTLAAFTITAYDGLGASAQFPQEAPAKECLIRWGEPTPAGGLGVYRMWMTEATRTTWATRNRNSNSPLDVTFLYGDHRVIYNATSQYSGSPFHTGGFSGPTGGACDYDCVMPDDDRLLGETDVLLVGPGTFGDDSSFIREQMAWWIGRRIGLASTHRRFCRVFVNGMQRQTVFEDAQQPNGDWVQQYWPDDDDGYLHKAQDWIEFGDDGATFQTDVRAVFARRLSSGVHKVANYRYQWAIRSIEGSANDFSALSALIDAHNTGTSGTDPAYFAAMDPLVDQDAWARALAIQRIVGNWDTWGWNYGKNMYIYKPARGQWAMTAWDMDFSFGLTGSPATSDLFSNGSSYDPNAPGDPLATKFRNQPDFRRAYWRAFRDAVDEPMLAANANAHIDAMVAGLTANGVTPNASQVTTVKNYIAARRTYLLSQLNTTFGSVNFALNGSSTLNDEDGALTLTGTAPPGVRYIRINGVLYTPQWTNQTTWSLPLSLYAQNNNLSLEALGTRGNVLATVPVTITVTGPPALPQVTINEWMPDNTSAHGFSDPADGSYEDWFELYNAGTAPVNLGGFLLTDNANAPSQFTIPDGTVIPAGGYLLVWADDETEQNSVANGQLHTNFKLSADGEEIVLSTSDGTVVDMVTFAAPGTDVAGGRYPDGAMEITTPAPTPGRRNALRPGITGITNAGAAGGSITLSTEPGHYYQVESSADMSAWTSAGTPQQATGATLTLELPANSTAGRLFWRAVLRPAPVPVP